MPEYGNANDPSSDPRPQDEEINVAEENSELPQDSDDVEFDDPQEQGMVDLFFCRRESVFHVLNMLTIIPAAELEGAESVGAMPQGRVYVSYVSKLRVIADQETAKAHMLSMGREHDEAYEHDVLTLREIERYEYPIIVPGLNKPFGIDINDLVRIQDVGLVEVGAFGP
ncbi:MAG: hypothetical protein HYX66_08810 [Ignavibacteria bacterium]|nr:hypothetical protein [Ignavibacteria bacterium]